jgi:hypothetical protein
MLDANAVESARFDRARKDARTSCGGLLDGQRFDRIAGKAEVAWREDRKEGPPYTILVKLLSSASHISLTQRNACYDMNTL